MRNLLTFEEFVNESYNVYSEINENKYATDVKEQNPSDMIPFGTSGREAYKTFIWVRENDQYTSITYNDISNAIPKGRLTSKQTYDIYVGEKLYLFKSVLEIWNLIPRGLKNVVKLPPKAPIRGGYFDFEPESGKIGVTVYNQIFGRGADRGSNNQLEFNIPKDESHDENVKAVKKFIKENCFNDPKMKAPSQEELIA